MVLMNEYILWQFEQSMKKIDGKMQKKKVKKCWNITSLIERIIDGDNHISNEEQLIS